MGMIGKCPTCDFILDDHGNLRSCPKCGFAVRPDPPTKVQSADEEPFAKKAAYWCAGLPLIHIVLMMVYNATQESDTQGTVAMIFFPISVCVLAASIVYGVIAPGLRRHGWRGILIRAVVGIAFSLSLLSYWLWQELSGLMTY